MHINEFQKMMRQLYFERDSERGTEGTLDWLIDEVEELKEALEEGNIEAAEKEFAEPLKIDMLGVDDRFGQSAPPWQLLRKFGLTAEHIVQRALELLKGTHTGKHKEPRVRS